MRKYWIIVLVIGLSSLTTLSAQTLYQDSLISTVVDSTSFDHKKTYWLEIETDNNSYLELEKWGWIENTTNGEKTGLMIPLSQHAFRSYLNVLQVEPNDKLLLKLKADHPLFELEEAQINTYTESEWRATERQRLIAHGLFFGILIVMALYNLMIYFAVRDQSYLWYVLSIAGFALYMGFYYGFSIEFLWPERPHWNAYFFALIIPLTNVCRILFTKTYLHTVEYVPRWNLFFRVLIGLYLIPVVRWFISWQEWAEWLVPANFVIGTFGSITMLTITLVSVIVYRKGYRPALWFLTAFLLFNIGGILFIFRELGYLPDNFFTRYVVQIGAVAQVILFSFGLSNRLNRTRKMLAMRTLEKEKMAREQEIEKTEMIEKQRQELEVQVRKRTEELEETLNQLKVSESELRELNQVKSRLFSIISHELKSPLTTVDSYLNLLINHFNKLTPDELSDLSDKTRFSLQNLTMLMDNLLLWSRLQQDSLAFNPSHIDLSKVVDKSIRLFALLIEQKKIEVVIDPEIDETILNGDKDMVEFIVRNLIHNSLKFTPKNGEIRIFATSENGLSTISVQDSGIGMTPEMIRQILERGEGFTRVGTEQEKGSGIGLLMCKDFVEKNGGELKIHTVDGTRVSFSVPNVNMVGV
ncbi:MAG: sensor histidine kinase [Cyclobacteriaceae bacterium]